MLLSAGKKVLEEQTKQDRVILILFNTVLLSPPSGIRGNEVKVQASWYLENFDIFIRCFLTLSGLAYHVKQHF